MSTPHAFIQKYSAIKLNGRGGAQLHSSYSHPMLHHVVQGSGVPTVWLHGLLGTGTSHWHNVLEDMPDQHFLPDLLGHGHSPDYGSATLNPPRQNAQALSQWMDAQGLERVHLVGVSLGADTALQFALESPGRVLTLTLVAASWYMTDATLSILREQLVTLGNQLRQPALADLLRKLHGERVPQEILERTTHAYLADPFQVSSQALERLNVPTLVVQGDAQVGEVQQGLELRQHIPHCHLAVLPATGHVAHMENPEGFLLARTRFLDNLI